MNELRNTRHGSRTVQHELLDRGFVKSVASDGAEEPRIPREIKEGFAHLDEDPYAPHSGRYRSYSRMLYLPWRDSLEWLPEVTRSGQRCSPYDQGSFNQEYQHLRYFPAIAADIKKSDFLMRLVRSDLRCVSGIEAFEHWPVYVGVHLIRLQPHGADEKAGTTPDRLHQDGGVDMFTFVHLIGISNAKGGDTSVAKPAYKGMLPQQVPSDGILGRFKLTNPLDWYAVNDQAVSHHAAAISAEQSSEPATRDVILLGLSPYKPIFF